MSTAKLTRSAPYFPVTDVARAAAHYQGVFGFTTEYSAGSPAEFAIVTRDGFSIMLRRVPDASPISPNERQGGTWDVFFWVSDVRALHAELTANGADVVYGPLLQAAYHMEEFAVRDEDGYVLGFGQPVTA
jgi:catechol 2,3-dioxygenase-like lactoylglutathione lyase family enzyme